ncbi:NF038122 family metalloprotease [Sphingomonas sp. Tas61C01]|uniref:NF038122 family metalloprotease n=1 Tax=Sphingomonas sp. Tas61C01 TaxID=3458297 RepID=UPI00403E5FB4
MMKLKQLLCCGAAIALSATNANAAVINLIDIGGVNGSPAENGFKIAALYWGSVLTNDVTINLGVGFSSLAPNVLGSTGSSRADYSVSNWERQIGLTKSGSLLDRTAILPKLGGDRGATFITNGVDADGNDDTSVKAVVLGDTTSSQILYANTSVLKAIGARNSNNPAIDGNVTFSSDFAFDFNPSDGVDRNSFDFIGVAIHEIGHALGFVSGVDIIDYYGGPNGPKAGTLGYSLNDTSIYSALDMFRYSKDPSNLVFGNKPVLDLSVGTDSYFSIDGGKTALFGNTYSTGAFNGDESQASHWRDAMGTTYEQVCTKQLGIMDPTFCRGQRGEVTALDLAAYDAMGWNISFDVLQNPGYLATTSSIYSQFLSAVPEPTTWAMMLTGFAMVGGALRGGRSRTKVKVSFAG